MQKSIREVCMPFDAKTSLHQAAAKTNGVRGLSFPVQLPESTIEADAPVRLQAAQNPPNQLILSVPISLVDLKMAVGTILLWTQNRVAKYVCVRDVHGLMISLRNPALMDIHRAAGMVTPDGMPLVWISKWRSKLPVKRVCGADLVDALCNDGQSSGLRHYFYGGKPGIAESMIRNLKAKYPDLVVAGFYTPPFRSLTEEEDAAIVDAINKSGAQVVWIGLSTPNQEFWTRDHVGQINGATLIGVGAAFDFHSGAVTRAPKWMQNSGFEWLHRLLSEPRRLWRRYLVIAPSFVVRIVREEIGFRLAKRRPLSSHVAAARHD
jgi:N-acetylglucosaminyldiphosphoundecaprenol N-acetyl-beta-D-mannosaminyltransferase